MNRRQTLRRWVGSILLAAAATLPAARTSSRAAQPPATGPLRVHPDNPRYFTDSSGQAILLVGSHTWPSLVDMGPSDPPARFDFDAFLGFLEKHGHNFVRLWTWEHTTWDTRGNRETRRHHCAPLPYARTGPGKALDGKPKFNLTRYDTEYFGRLRRRVAAAGKRGIYVSVMLFEGWAMQHSPGAWEGHPFHPKNNTSGIDGDTNADGKGLEVHELVDPKVTAIQEAYVRKVIDTVGDLDNVLYEISNENHPPSTKWQYHMIDFIHACEKTRPKQHPVGMTFQYKGGRNRVLFDSPAEWVSPNPSTDVPKGHNYRDNPPPADGRKVILTDTDHLWGIGGDYRWVWKSLLRGLNPIFMDPYDGQVLGQRHPENWPALRAAMGHALRLARRVNLAAMTPQGKLASTGYCLANAAKTGAEYLVYLPDGGKVTVDLGASGGKLHVEWLDPKTGRATKAEAVAGGARRRFQAPMKGDAVLYLAHRKRGE